MKKTIIKILLIMLVLIMGFSGGMLLKVFIQEKLAERYWENIERAKQTENTFNSSNILSKYQTLYEQNSDIVGWIKIEGTKINYPVMQTKNYPEYYLRKNFDKKYDSLGTPFVDYRCDVLPEQSFNTIIYSHYTSGDGGFRWLFNYEAESWYKEHKVIQFDTIQEESNYEVVAVFYYDAAKVILKKSDDKITQDSYEFYNYIKIDSAEGYRKFIRKIEDRRLYETEAEIKMTDHLITLICCAPEVYSGFEENGRLVVIAKKMK